MRSHILIILKKGGGDGGGGCGGGGWWVVVVDFIAWIGDQIARSIKYEMRSSLKF